MSWRDALRAGSFRGAGFKIQTGEAEGGRRGEVHEYPERDEPWFEDLGRKAKQWTVECVVLGAEYMGQRDALIAACEKNGAGTLIHPYLGELSVVCPSYSFRESSEEGGAAFFTLEFAEPGEPTEALAKPDTSIAAVQEADRVQAAAPAHFAGGFDASNMPAFVETSAANQVRDLAELAGLIGVSLGGAGSALRTYESGLAALPSGALSLVRTPLSLGHAVVGLVMAVAGLSASPTSRVRALRQLLGSRSVLPPFISSTPARIREQSNAGAFSRLVAVVTTAEAVRAASSIRFTSYDEAIQLRDALAEDIDQAATEAADAGDDTAAGDLDQLRLIMVRDITARGGSLERLYDYTPQVTEPALTIAQRLYGEPSVVADRADELVERNRIPHPGFVPGGQPLQVRTLSDSGGGNG
jgi:prophage DNA circulation protein